MTGNVQPEIMVNSLVTSDNSAKDHFTPFLPGYVSMYEPRGLLTGTPELPAWRLAGGPVNSLVKNTPAGQQ